MRILLLARYGNLGASSRLRSYQYLPILKRAGIQCTTSAFFDDAYLGYYYARSRRSVSAIARAYARRIEAVRNAGSANAVWVEKEVFPFLPGWADALLQRAGVPYVLDFDDATFHKYDQHRVRLVRELLGNKLDALLSEAAAVTVGNEYVAQYVVHHGARKVVRIPTVVDLERYPIAREPAGDVFRIGWIGTPVTTKYLEAVRRPLIEFSKQYPTCLVTIGASTLGDFGLPLEQHPWSLETEVSLIGSVHMGIMPLPDAPWERGKCAYKLIQYMACGKAVAASPVGMNREVVSGDVGYLCDGDDEWIAAFRFLADERERRVEMGLRGRRLVEGEYSLSVTAPRLVEVLRDVCL